MLEALIIVVALAFVATLSRLFSLALADPRREQRTDRGGRQ